MPRQMHDPKPDSEAAVDQRRQDQAEAPRQNGQIPSHFDPASMSPPDVIRLQRTLGNQAVVDLMAQQAGQASAAPERPSHTFSSGQTLFLKRAASGVAAPTGGETIQRKLGNRGKKNDWVWFEPDTPGSTNARGKIRATVWEKKFGVPRMIFSKKYRNMVPKVKDYFVTMEENEHTKEDEKVSPLDAAWHLTPPSDRKHEEGDDAETKETESDEASMLPGGAVAKGKDLLAVGKGVAGAGKVVAGMGSAFLSKTKYYETNVDTAVTVLDKAAAYIDKAAHVFPLAKPITVPVAKVTGVIKKLRKAQLVVRLVKDPQAIPLTLTGFNEAEELLASIDQATLRSDDRDVVVDAMAALASVHDWLEAQRRRAGGEDEPGEVETKEAEGSEE